MVPLMPILCFDTLFLIPLLFATIYACEGLFRWDTVVLEIISDLLNWLEGMKLCLEDALEDFPLRGVFLD